MAQEVINPAERIQELEQQRDALLDAIKRLSFAAACRDNTMGDPIRAMEVRAELMAANKRAREVIANVGSKE
jgi:hypothetical protein